MKDVFLTSICVYCNLPASLVFNCLRINQSKKNEIDRLKLSNLFESLYVLKNLSSHVSLYVLLHKNK